MNVTYNQLITELQHKKYRPVYFLMGDEPYYIDKAAEYIENNILQDAEKDFNLSVLYGKDVDIATVVNTAKRYPMMSEHQVVIVKEAQQIKAWDDLVYYLSNPQQSTILCFCYKYGKPDGRRKWFQAILANGGVLESKTLYENQIGGWIKEYLKKNHIGIDEKAVAMLVEFLGNNLSKIANEMDKLLIIKQKNQEKITPELIEENIGISKDYNVFELQAALINRNVLKTNRIIKYFGNNKKANPIQMVLTQLFNFFSNVMLYHYMPNKDKNYVATELKINPYFVKDYVQAAKVFSARKTMHILSYIRQADARSKGVEDTGTAPEALMKELVFKILH